MVGLPITSNDKLFVRRQMDASQRAAAESMGRVMSDGTTRTYTAAGGTGTLQLAGFTQNPGKMSKIRSVTVSCYNKGLNVMVIYGQMAYNKGNMVAYGCVPKGGGQVTIPLDVWLHEGVQLNVYAISPLPETVSPTDPYVIYTSSDNDMFTEEINFDAKEMLLCIGDSITAGNATTSDSSHKGKDTWPFQLRDYLRGPRRVFGRKGRDIRLVNLGSPGIATWEIRALMESGRYNCLDPTIITYMAGVNDIASGWTPAIQASIESNINYAILWKQTFMPNAKLICYGNTPQGDSKEASVANIRSFLEARVLQLNDPNVYYCNLGASFLPSDTTKYSDGATHLNIAGNLAVTAVNKDFIDSKPEF